MCFSLCNPLGHFLVVQKSHLQLLQGRKGGEGSSSMWKEQAMVSGNILLCTCSSLSNPPYGSLGRQTGPSQLLH